MLKLTSDSNVIVIGLVPHMTKSKNGIMVLLLPLLRVEVQDVPALLFLTESVKLGSEDLVGRLRGLGGGVVSVYLVILGEGSLEVRSDGGSDEGWAGGEDGVLGWACGRAVLESRRGKREREEELTGGLAGGGGRRPGGRQGGEGEGEGEGHGWWAERERRAKK